MRLQLWCGCRRSENSIKGNKNIYFIVKNVEISVLLDYVAATQNLLKREKYFGERKCNNSGGILVSKEGSALNDTLQ